MDGRQPKSDSLWFSAARWVMLGLLMVAPLAFGAVESWAWTTLVVGTGTVLLLWAIGCSAAGQVRIRWSAAYLAAGMGIGLVGWQYLAGRTADYVGTRESLIKLVGYIAILFVSGQIFGSRTNIGVLPKNGKSIHSNRAAITYAEYMWRQIGAVLTIYVFVMALFAIIQFFSSPGLVYWTIRPQWGGYIFGPYINHNHYAGLMELTLPLVVGSELTNPTNSKLKYLGSFTVILAIASVLISGSRGGSIAMLAQLTLFTILLARMQTIERRKITVITGVGFILVSVIAFTWLDAGSAWQRWEKMAEAPHVETQSRYAMTADAITMWRKHPVVGVGAGSFGAVYPEFQSWVTDNITDHAHNDYAELLAETGTIGGAISLAFVSSLIWCGVRRLRQGVRKTEHQIQMAALISCCGLLVHGFTDFNLHIPANAAWFAFAAGLVCVRPADELHVDI